MVAAPQLLHRTPLLIHRDILLLQPGCGASNELAEVYPLASPENNLKSEEGMKLRSMFAFILPICVEIHKIVTPGGGA